MYYLPEINNVTADPLYIPFNTLDIPFNTRDISHRCIPTENKVDSFYNILNLNRPYINITSLHTHKFDTSYFATKNTFNDYKENFINSNNKVF